MCEGCEPMQAWMLEGGGLITSAPRACRLGMLPGVERERLLAAGLSLLSDTWFGS